MARYLSGKCFASMAGVKSTGSQELLPVLFDRRSVEMFENAVH
jgi:hypothetical protein